METLVTPFREIIGNINWMKQLERQYSFPIDVYKENEDGSRTLLRTEAGASA
ncbi:hypothetical protein OIE82_27245 [Streptomyces althioticus]|jgi:hypothetical protein|uniref:Uncharacterized protein n=1 Tax=Streptomyces althioticus TaxID=83380 RepID=A0ABZ1YEM4_9ACTN